MFPRVGNDSQISNKLSIITMQSAPQTMKSEFDLQIFTNEPIFILPFVVTNN